MITATNILDEELRSRIESLSENDDDYWSFKGNSKREHGHGLFQYPAMMVPQVVRTVLKEACCVYPGIGCVGDPFVGSGTVLTESMIKGLDFIGQDINPLAILLCKVKSGPFFIEAIFNKAEDLHSRLSYDSKNAIEVIFPGRDKWFRKDVQIALSKIRRAIVAEPALWARRFFWIAMAETVKYSSNSRTSTFKLHTRTAEDIASRNLDPISLFRKTLDRNLKHFRTQHNYLNENGCLIRGRYYGKVKVQLADTRKAIKKKSSLCDIILTSPPYGDNASTVPYGQYSFLPLQWIDMCDIDESATVSYLKSTHEIDTKSLGGSKRVAIENFDFLADRSPRFVQYIECLKDQPVDRTKRVTAFFRDLEDCIGTVLGYLNPGGLMVWTLGNRKVGGNRVPLDTILLELLSTYGAKQIVTLKRRISSKRMAPKNSITETMSDETILVLRKAI